jgi:adenine-specific DNA glycosylase
MPRRRGKAAWAFNQAIMELGALICTARVAKCGECPVRTACATGRRIGGQADGRSRGQADRRTGGSEALGGQRVQSP